MDPAAPLIGMAILILAVHAAIKYAPSDHPHRWAFSVYT